MKGTVAVSQDLTNVRDALERDGYRVIDLDEKGMEADLIIMSGMKRDILGIQDIRVDVPVIDASGRQAEEILYDVEKRMNLKE